MSSEEPKRQTPAYAPYKTLTNFINSLAETGLPTQIDRSMMRGMSGSAQAAVIASLEFLKLVSPTGEPSKELQQLVDSPEEQRGTLLRPVLERSYSFLFNGSIDLKRATTKQVEDAFRAQGISGSTVVKCMSFFLAAAKAAGIQVSPHVKTPALPRATTKRSANADTTKREQRDDEDVSTPLAPPPGMRALRFQLFDKPDAVLTVPEDFSQEDWDFLLPILTAYVNRMFNKK